MQTVPIPRHPVAASGLSLLLALLPKCPLCLVAHGSALGALGIGGGVSLGAWTRPLVVASILAVLGLLAARARTRRGYGPAVLAALGGALVLAETFHRHAPAAHAHGAAEPHSVLLAWGGVALLFAATTWNAWPRRAASAASGCPSHAHPSADC